MTTRVAPSFLRVGHFELFARRARDVQHPGDGRAELRKLARHAIFREFPHLADLETLEAQVAATGRVGSCVRKRARTQTSLSHPEHHPEVPKNCLNTFWNPDCVSALPETLKKSTTQPKSLAAPCTPCAPQVLAMLDEVAARFARLAAHWLRVGYVQSNFNSDNCLVSGRTVTGAL